MNEELYRFLLFFCNPTFITPLIVIGINFINKKAFVNAAIMMFFSAFVSAYLKNIWQVPLHHSVGTHTYAFPSGHTQVSITLWLCLFYYFKKPWLIALVSIMLILDFNSMVYFKYHNWIDIGGGAGFGFLIFILFVIWQKLTDKQLMLALTTALISFIIYCTLPHIKLDYSYLMVYSGLYFGFILYLILENLNIECIKLNTRLISFFKALGLLIIIFCINHFIDTNVDKYITKFIKGALVAILCLILIPIMANQVDKIYCKLKKING